MGDLVFKARNPGDPKYTLPSAYKNHPDQRDYYHVGVVTCLSPLEITHCTSGSGCEIWSEDKQEWVPATKGGIKHDKALGAWHYTGSLNLIDGGGGSVVVDYQATVVAGTGSTVNLRSNPSTNAKVLKAVPVGAVVDVLEEYNETWSKINSDGTVGYMMRKFLKKNDEPIPGQKVTLLLDKDVALALYAALQDAVKE